MLKRIDDRLPVLNLVPAVIVVIVLAAVLEMTGIWVTMFIAGGIGALFLRRTLYAFVAGFVGVAVAWTLIFLYLIITAQALGVAEVFAALLGLRGMGGLVIVISILLGGLAGGLGGVLSRASIELIDDLLLPVQPTPHTTTSNSDRTAGTG